jgi:hypothetical protein
MKDETINETSCKLLKNHKVATRVKELQDMALEKHSTTVESLLDEYDEAKKLALKIERPEAAIKAIDGKARITGHDKKVIDLKATVSTVELDPKEYKKVLKEMLDEDDC